MDCLFNSRIPKSSSTQIIFRPAEKTFITGISSKYLFYYDKRLLGDRIKESQFNYMTSSLNEELFRNWPSMWSLLCGYVFTPCTLGISCICPYSCISVAKESLLLKIDHFNMTVLEPKGLKMDYHQSCSTSWISLSIIDSIRTLGTMNSTRSQSKKEKEFEFGSQTEVFLKSVDSQMKVNLK